MQKKVNRFWVLFLFITASFFLLPHLCNAQRNRHALMLWGEAGYSAFFTKWDAFKNAGNMGVGAGFGYNVVIRNHLIISTGIEYISLNSSVRPIDLLIYKDLTDTEGDEYTMEYTIQKLSQFDKTHNIFIPIYIGFKTNLRRIDFRGNFFMQAGGKIGYMFASNYTSKIVSYTTVGIYDRFFDPFKNMPNHFFDTKKYRSTNSLNFNKLQVVASIEIGMEFLTAADRTAMRISLFADCGVTNRQTPERNRQQNELIIFKEIPNDIYVNSLYETNFKLSKNTTSFFTGIKMTFLFDVMKPPRHKCVPPKPNVYKKKR